MNILSYDYHSAFEPSVNHHSPLYSLEEESEYNYDSQLTIVRKKLPSINFPYIFKLRKILLLFFLLLFFYYYLIGCYSEALSNERS